MNIASVDQISISRSNVQSADIIIGTVISEFNNSDETQLDASIFLLHFSRINRTAIWKSSQSYSLKLWYVSIFKL